MLGWAYLIVLAVLIGVAVVRHWRQTDELHRQGYRPVKWTGFGWIWRRRH
jgi:hypothetical protein